MKKIVIFIAVAATALFSAIPVGAETIVPSLTGQAASKAIARGEQVCSGWSVHGSRLCIKRVGGKEVADFQRRPETPETTIVVKVKSKDCAADLLSENCIDEVAIEAVKAVHKKALAR